MNRTDRFLEAMERLLETRVVAAMVDTTHFGTMVGLYATAAPETVPFHGYPIPGAPLDDPE